MIARSSMLVTYERAEGKIVKDKLTTFQKFEIPGFSEPLELKSICMCMCVSCVQWNVMAMWCQRPKVVEQIVPFHKAGVSS